MHCIKTAFRASGANIMSKIRTHWPPLGLAPLSTLRMNPFIVGSQLKRACNQGTVSSSNPRSMAARASAACSAQGANDRTYRPLDRSLHGASDTHHTRQAATALYPSNLSRSPTFQMVH